MTATPGWLDELRPTPGPPWHRLGTRRVDPSAWLVGGDDVSSLLGEKRRLLVDESEAVVHIPPDAEDAAATVASFVSSALAGAPDGSDHGDPGDDVHPLVRVSRRLVEDLCVLRRDERGVWRLAAGVVCFPSHWRLDEKIGRSVAAIHHPVPAYDEDLGDRVDRAIEGLRPNQPVWRRNWLLHDHADLFAPTPPTGAGYVRVPDGLWLRSERQTLVRLDGDVTLFAIRTQQVPLAVLTTKPSLAVSMGEAIRSWDTDLVEYRNARTWRERAVEWLDAAASAGSG